MVTVTVGIGPVGESMLEQGEQAMAFPLSAKLSAKVQLITAEFKSAEVPVSGMVPVSGTMLVSGMVPVSETVAVSEDAQS